MAFKFMSLLKMYLTCLKNEPVVGLLSFTLGNFGFSLSFRFSFSFSQVSLPMPSFWETRIVCKCFIF